MLDGEDDSMEEVWLHDAQPLKAAECQDSQLLAA